MRHLAIAWVLWSRSCLPLWLLYLLFRLLFFFFLRVVFFSRNYEYDNWNPIKPLIIKAFAFRSASCSPKVIKQYCTLPEDNWPCFFEHKTLRNPSPNTKKENNTIWFFKWVLSFSNWCEFQLTSFISLFISLFSFHPLLIKKKRQQNKITHQN